MTHLLSVVALLGAASPAHAGVVDEPTTLGIPYEDPVDPSAHEARERGRPSARGGPSARPTPARATARPAGRSPRAVPAGRTAGGGAAHRPYDQVRPTPRHAGGCPPASCGTPGGRPGGPGGASQRPDDGRPTTSPPHGGPTAGAPGGRPGGDPHGAPPTTRPGGPSGGRVVTRPGGPVVRPGGAVVTRPGAVVTRPGVAVARPGVVVRPVHTVRYTQVYPYHGVFVYGPRPVTHVTYVQGGGPVQVPRRDLPRRELNREGSLAIGASVGQLVSSTASGVYADPGVSLVGRYRPAEALGLELGVGHFAGAFSTEEVRSNTNVNGQLKLFAFPWSKVSPYALVGGVYNVANVQSELLAGDTAPDTYRDGQLGLDGGLGLELALGTSLALDLEGRYIGWMGREDGQAPGAFLLNGGLAFHFR